VGALLLAPALALKPAYDAKDVVNEWGRATGNEAVTGRICSEWIKEPTTDHSYCRTISRSHHHSGYTRVT
jgi:hypothetical protein